MEENMEDRSKKIPTKNKRVRRIVKKSDPNAGCGGCMKKRKKIKEEKK